MRLFAVAFAVALLAACNGSKDEPTPPANAGDRIQVIAKGTRYDSKDYIVAGKVSILEFTADW